MLNLYNIAPGVTAFSTTRHGGVSKDNYGTLNINPYCGDNPADVAANRRLLAETLQVEEGRIVLPHQVHETSNLLVDEVFCSYKERKGRVEGFDSLTTNLRQVCIGVSTADCIPVLLYDAAHHAAAAVHAGWRGTVKRIVSHTLQAMAANYGTKPEEVIAVVGPGISLKNFEVGDEVYAAFAAAGFDMPKIARRFPCAKGPEKEKWHIDLPQANRLLLEKAGLKDGNITMTGICTYDHVDDYFSARRLGQHSGRIFTGIILR